MGREVELRTRPENLDNLENLSPVENLKLKILTFDNLTMKVIKMLTTAMIMKMTMVMTVASQFAMSSAK